MFIVAFITIILSSSKLWKPHGLANKKQIEMILLLVQSITFKLAYFSIFSLNLYNILLKFKDWGNSLRL